MSIMMTPYTCQEDMKRFIVHNRRSSIPLAPKQGRKCPPPNTITLWIKFQHMNFERIPTFSLWHQKLCPAILSIKCEGRIKTFLDNQVLNKFTSQVPFIKAIGGCALPKLESKSRKRKTQLCLNKAGGGKTRERKTESRKTDLTEEKNEVNPQNNKEGPRAVQQATCLQGEENMGLQE